MFDSDDINQTKLAQTETQQELVIDRAELLAEAPRRNVQTQVENFGQIKNLPLPQGWVEADRAGGQLNTQVHREFHPQGANDVSISVFYRGAPIRENFGQDFLDVLNAHPARNGPERLSPDEIKKLSDVMDFNTVGNNQYTNDAAKGTREYHTFHLTAAETVNINGRTVLRVRGTFQDKDGLPQNEYHGIFIPADPKGTQIEEIYLSAKTKGKLLLHEKDFNAALKGLSWK